MAKIRRNPDLDPYRAGRNSGKRVPPEGVDTVQEIIAQRIAGEGVSQPFSEWFEDLTLPGLKGYRFAPPRDGQVNELSVYAKDVLDGPVYLRVESLDAGVPLLDDKKQAIEKKLEQGEWITLPPFRVSQNQRLIFRIVSEPIFTPNIKPADRPAMIGSTSASLSDIHITFMYFSQGGNLGTGQESKRLPAPRPPK